MVFDGIHFADLWVPIKKRLNTTHIAYGGSTETNSLTGAHDLLLSDTQPLDLIDLDQTENHVWYQENPCDPFDDSGSAVYCYKECEFLPILQHNLADIHRIWELGEILDQ